MKCIGCISPLPLPLLLPLAQTLVPLTVHTPLRAFVCPALPLPWDSCPLGYVSLSLSLSPPLPLRLHRPLPSLGHSSVELFFMWLRPLFYSAATRRRPLVESRPAKESLRSLIGCSFARVLTSLLAHRSLLRVASRAPNHARAAHAPILRIGIYVRRVSIHDSARTLFAYISAAVEAAGSGPVRCQRMIECVHRSWKIY